MYTALGVSLAHDTNPLVDGTVSNLLVRVARVSHSPVLVVARVLSRSGVR